MPAFRGPSLRRVSVGLADVEAIQAPPIPRDDARERFLRCQCLELLCDPDPARRAPLHFGIQMIRSLFSIPYKGATPLALRYVPGIRYVIATNDTELFPGVDMTPAGGSLMDCLDQGGWVLPVRPHTSSASGARVRIVLTDNLKPVNDADHLTLLILEGDLGRTNDKFVLPRDFDLSTLQEPHKVTQDEVICKTHSEFMKRLQCWCMIGPTPRGCFGARVGVGRVTICLDDLWEDIYGMLQRVYMGAKTGTPGTLKHAFIQYDKYLKRLRAPPIHVYAMGPEYPFE